MNQKLKKLIASLCAAAILVTPSTMVQASINGDLTDFFNQIGGYSNVTSGGAFNGQSQNLVTGGSLYLRLPQQSYSLANLQLPGIKAGCGGIDAFAGSFSFINKEQFTAMLRNIGNGALGYVFQLGIDAVDPLIGNVLEKMRKASEFVNGMNINSCEAGQALVNGIVGKTDLASQQGCSSLSAYLNLSSDRSDAMGKCSDPINRTQVADAVRSDPSTKDSASIELISGNLMARVLSKAYPWMTSEEMNLLISLTGTYLVDASGTNGPIRKVVNPSITSESDIVAGVQGTSSSDMVTVMMLDCSDPDQTTCSDPEPKQIKSLRALVEQRLTEYEAIMEQGGSTWAAGKKSEMIGFVNVTTLPVLKLLKTDFARQSDLRNAYTDLIASQYAIFYLENMVKKAAAAVANYPSLSAGEEEKVKDMRDRLMHLKDVLSRNEQSNHNKATALTNVQLQLAKFDEVLRNNDSALALRIEAARSFNNAAR